MTSETLPPASRSTISAAVVELLFRFELGDFNATVRRRLLDLFTTDPADVLERLERACTYLGITGDGIIDVMRRSDQQVVDQQASRADAPLLTPETAILTCPKCHAAVVTLYTAEAWCLPCGRRMQALKGS